MKEAFETMGEHWAVTLWIGLVLIAIAHGNLTLIKIGGKNE